MDLSTKASNRQRPLVRQHDRRRYQRVGVNLLGRFMLEDRQEYPCQTQNISPGSVAIVTPVLGRVASAWSPISER